MKVLPALAAIGVQVVAAQNSAICTTSTYSVTEMAQATNIPCRTMEGTIEVSGDIEGDLVIDGPSRIRGGLHISNATRLNSLSSTSLTTIDQDFELLSLESLSSINMPSLESIRSIKWITLPSLENLRLGEAGVTTVENIEISDTSLRNLDDFNVASVVTMSISNNWRLTSYSTQLSTVNDTMTFASNGEEGNGVNITLSNLVWAKNLVFNQVNAVLVPSLEYINDSLRLDLNDLDSFIAPNLTEVGSGDLSFFGNRGLENISFPLLERIGGSLTVLNNTDLEVIDGFPKLERIGGAVRMGGDFTEVELPALNDAVGGFQLLSTGKLGDSCDAFDDQEGREIRGVYRCRGEEDEANDEDSFDNDGSGSGGSSNSNDDDSAAGLLSANMVALMAAVVIGSLAQL